MDALAPRPAYLLAPNWDLLGFNRAEAGLIGDPAAGWEIPERNLLRLVFTHARIRELLTAWPA